MPDYETLVVSRAAQSQCVDELLQKGVDSSLFLDDGVRVLWDWMVDHYRRFNVPPSYQACVEAANELAPDLRFEIATDATDFLIERFFASAKRRHSGRLLMALADAMDDPDEVERIEEHFMVAARELATLIPSSYLYRYSDAPKRIDQYHAERFKGGVSKYVPYGIPFLDDLTLGIQPHEFVVISGWSGTGKALALDTPIPTPAGWTTQGDLKVGDEIFDERGHIARVVALGPVMYDRPCRRLVMDGDEIIADAEHEWRTLDSRGHPAIRETDEIGTMLQRTHATGSTANQMIEMAPGLNLPAVDLPIDPYVLGAWLGDGHSRGGRITTADQQIVDEISKHYEVTSSEKRINFGILGLQELKALGVFGAKHIPAQYLRGSRSQRLDLLRGLMDTDGYVNTRGECEFTTTSGDLYEGVFELLVSLGFKPWAQKRRATLNGKDCGPKWRIQFRPGPETLVFRLDRKVAIQLQAKPVSPRSTRRVIRTVENHATVPVRCIQVSSPSGLYLAGRSMTPTHNSTLLFFMMWSAYLAGYTPMIFSLEMDADAVQRKFDTLASHFSYTALKKLDLPRKDLERWEKAAERAANARNDIIVFNDVGKINVERVYGDIVKYRPDIVGIDYLSLMKAPRRTDSVWEGVSMISNDLKATALGLKVPIVSVAQTNAGKEEAGFAGSNMAYSKSITRDADIIIHLFRDEAMKLIRKMRLDLAKNRDGQTGSVELFWDVDHMRIEPWRNAMAFADKEGVPA